jgi:hypothetical protein
VEQILPSVVNQFIDVEKGERTFYWRCPFDKCKEICATSSFIERHMREQHYEEIPIGVFGERSEYNCKLCTRTKPFKRREHFLKHKQSLKHLEVAILNNVASKQDKELYADLMAEKNNYVIIKNLNKSKEEREESVEEDEQEEAEQEDEEQEEAEEEEEEDEEQEEAEEKEEEDEEQEEDEEKEEEDEEQEEAEEEEQEEAEEEEEEDEEQEEAEEEEEEDEEQETIVRYEEADEHQETITEEDEEENIEAILAWIKETEKTAFEKNKDEKKKLLEKFKSLETSIRSTIGMVRKIHYL